MAFVDWVLNNPGYDGIEDPEEVGVENRPDPPRLISAPSTYVRTGDLNLLMSPMFNQNNAAVNRWQVLQEGGSSDGGNDGVVPRPENGMIYPRR